MEKPKEKSTQHRSAVAEQGSFRAIIDVATTRNQQAKSPRFTNVLVSSNERLRWNGSIRAADALGPPHEASELGPSAKMVFARGLLDTVKTR